jgi:hypothetical protein
MDGEISPFSDALHLFHFRLSDYMSGITAMPPPKCHGDEPVTSVTGERLGVFYFFIFLCFLLKSRSRFVDQEFA